MSNTGTQNLKIWRLKCCLPKGSVFRFFNDVARIVQSVDQNNNVITKYYYNGTALSDVQIELARIKENNSTDIRVTRLLARLKIHEGMWFWKDNPNDYYFRLDDIEASLGIPGSTFLQLYNGNDMKVSGTNRQLITYYPVCNGDSMHHVNKGVMGLRIDGAVTIDISKLSINNIQNISEPGSLLCGQYETSMETQGGLIGYQGAKAYGIILSSVRDLRGKCISVNGVNSTNGTSVGLMCQRECKNIKINKMSFKRVSSDVSPSDIRDSELPNIIKPPSNLDIIDSKDIVICSNSS